MTRHPERSEGPSLRANAVGSGGKVLRAAEGAALRMTMSREDDDAR
jgi:hypothetical protein